MNRFPWFALVILVALAVSCRGKQSMASKSAAAYREAVAQGIPVAAGGHGGEHAHEMPNMPQEGMQQMKNMPGMQHGAMAGMEHGPMQPGTMHNMPAMQRGAMANMPGMQHGAMAGMEHGQMQHGAMQSMPGMEHGMAGMQHNMPGMQHGSAASVVIAAPSTSSSIAQLSPTSTLQQDEFDRPAAVPTPQQQPPEEKQWR